MRPSVASRGARASACCSTDPVRLLITIRRLAVEDWALFRDVRMAALSDAPDAFGATLAETLAATDDEWRMRLAHRVHFVAVDDGGAVVGTIGVFPSDERAGCSQVVSMWVAPEARGRGVGDALLDAALQAANGGQVHLWVSEGNNHAERLYARHGFARTGAVQPVRAEDPDRLEFEMAKSA